jgi:hypothetical protein
MASKRSAGQSTGNGIDYQEAAAAAMAADLMASASALLILTVARRTRYVFAGPWRLCGPGVQRAAGDDVRARERSRLVDVPSRQDQVPEIVVHQRQEFAGTSPDHCFFGEHVPPAAACSSPAYCEASQDTRRVGLSLGGAAARRLFDV